MAWSLDKNRGVWVCTNYTDLDGDAINKLAEFGEPFTPYEHPGFDPDFEPDFANVVVEMPQIQVMTHGYGRNVKPEDFPIVKRFLGGPFPLPNGTYTFDDLLKRGYAKNASERWINTNLYGWGLWAIGAGDLDYADGAYVHGSVSLALMSDTKFTSQPTYRRVEAVIGAGDDNWDFESATIPAGVETTVATVLGPDHYNLEKPIKIHFTGAGKRSVVNALQVPPKVIPHP
jgi:hypothetical protein